MKKILIVVLSAIASLGVAFGASVVASADEITITSLDEIKGKELLFKSTGNSAIGMYSWEATFQFTSDERSFDKMKNANEANGNYYQRGLNYVSGSTYTLANNGAANNGWTSENFRTILVDENTSFSFNGVTEQGFINFLNNNLESITTPAAPEPEPEPAGNLWTSILTGIGGFLSGMFALISGAFSGVVNVFYANNTATIILQALIFAAAAALVAAAVYVVVRLIKSAVARLRGGVGAAGAKGDKNKKSKRFFFRKRR